MNRASCRFGAALLLALPLAAVSARPATAATADSRLFDAIGRQDQATVRTLIKEGVDVNAALGDGSTALAWAAHRGDVETVELLLRARANANAADDHGVTPLALACENADAAIVEKLLAAGAKADVVQSNGVTPLMIAARTGNVAIVTQLLARGAPVSVATSKTKQTALMWAVAEGRRDAVQLLIDAHADVHATSAMGFSPLLFAARNGDVDIAKLLLAAGVDANECGGDGTHPLALAIVSGQADFARFLLDQGADANGSMFGVSALHAAAGSVEMWLREWLRVRGIDGVFGSGVVGLNRPARLDMVKALLTHGADPNARIETSTGVQGWLTIKRGAFEPFSIGTGDLKGATPLWVAAFSSNRGGTDPQVLKALLDGGADHTLTTADGTTPLMAAAGLGQGTFSPGKPRGDRSMGAEEAVKILVEAGADVNATNEAKFAVLHGAAFRGLNEVIEYLVQKGANIDAQDFTGRTAFRIAEGTKQSFQFQEWPETAEFVKKLGANTTLGMSGREQLRQEEREAQKKARGGNN
jgi:ankyrin repeat protein